MAIDFSNPLTWQEEMGDEDAINLAIFAMNTLAHPEGSDDHSVGVLDLFSDDAIARLCDLRERLDGSEVIDPMLRLSFTPDAIREHFEGDDPDLTAGLTDEELREVGEAALTSDTLYEEFHQILVWALEERN